MEGRGRWWSQGHGRGWGQGRGRGRERGKCSSTAGVWAPAVEDLNVDDTAFLINVLIHGHKHKINKPEQTVQITISITFVTLVNIPLNHSQPKKTWSSFPICQSLWHEGQFLDPCFYDMSFIIIFPNIRATSSSYYHTNAPSLGC